MLWWLWGIEGWAPVNEAVLAQVRRGWVSLVEASRRWSRDVRDRK